MTIFHHTEREMAVYVLSTSAWLTVGALDRHAPLYDAAMERPEL